MEDPDHTGQLPLPSMASTRAQVIRLPLPLKPPAPQKPRHKETKRRQRGDLWYALYFPQLQELPDAGQEQALKELAALAQEISATVSFHTQALVCEVRSSLNYFGGIDAIHERLQETIANSLQQRQLPPQFLYAASPTVSGSLLLARGGHNALVYRKDNLRSALGQLSIDALRLDKEQNRRLYNMGVRYLRDVWRLPSDGLRKRFGSDFVTLLDKALGRAPEPTHNYLPPPAFDTSYDLPYELESLDRLLPVADELLAQLCDFLRRRDLSTSHLLFSLQHEKRDSTQIDMGLRQPSRCREHLLLLLETHFASLSLPAPVIGLALRVEAFDAFMTRSAPLLNEDRAGGVEGEGTLDRFMEQLQARLGGNYVESIDNVAAHCPEQASSQSDYRQGSSAGPARPAPFPANPRPLWLLDKPHPLVVRNSRLYHRKPIAIISGPERIETSWWAGSDVCRDYYVAREQNGSRIWIFRDRQDRNWYLHGYFA